LRPRRTRAHLTRHSVALDAHPTRNGVTGEDPLPQSEPEESVATLS